MDPPGPSQSTNTCPDCGHSFTLAKDLLRHKRNKRPCVIREISEDDRKNPLVCKFCWRKFAKKQNLNDHLDICREKGLGTREEREAAAAPSPVLSAEDIKNAEIEKAKKFIDELAIRLNMRLTLSGTDLSYTSTPILCIKINPVTKPSLDNIICTPELIETHKSSLHSFFIDLIYFNPSARENYSIVSLSKKDDVLAFYEDEKWITDADLRNYDVLSDLLKKSIMCNGATLIKRTFPSLEIIRPDLRKHLEDFHKEPRRLLWNRCVGNIFADDRSDVTETHKILNTIMPQYTLPAQK
jgi:hypothetical protein